jgi:hypothetical protein
LLHVDVYCRWLRSRVLLKRGERDENDWSTYCQLDLRLVKALLLGVMEHAPCSPDLVLDKMHPHTRKFQRLYIRTQ